MQAEVGNAPMREAIARLERQYEVDKKNALGNPSIMINLGTCPLNFKIHQTLS